MQSALCANELYALCKEDCPEFKKKKFEEKGNHSGDVDLVSECDKRAQLIFVSEKKVSDEWVFNSGCTFHMCPHKNWLTSYRESNGGRVLLGNNKAYKVTEIGEIKLKLADGAMNSARC